MSRILLVLGAAVALTVVLPLFQQIPDGHKPVSTKADFITDSTPIPNYHMVFSTSCSPQQHWESMVFFYHAHKVKQPGTVTRIVSGCHEKDQLQSFHDQYSAVLNANFLLHETPDFSRIALTEGKHSYKYMNKPYGLQHWLDSHPELPDDDILMLLDPDMVLLRPLTHVFTSPTDQIIASEQSKVVVRHGHPVAQQDGYLDSAWTRLNVTYIANTTTPVPLPKASEGRLYWNSGPPYLMTIRDARRLAATWADYAPRVLDLYPKLFAEMFGYIHAAVQLNLPHTLVKSMVVSTTKSRDREGWSLIDALPDDRLCDPPVDAPMPIGLHYCKRYLLGKQFFSKYRMKKNMYVEQCFPLCALQT